MKGAQTLTLQKENEAEWRESFIVNSDMQQHGNILSTI
jgi:hypothetical protein